MRQWPGSWLGVKVAERGAEEHNSLEASVLSNVIESVVSSSSGRCVERFAFLLLLPIFPAHSSSSAGRLAAFAHFAV